MKSLIKICLLLVTVSVLINAQDEILKMPAIFSDNMVLQQNSNVNIWGKSNAGSKITVEGSWGNSVMTETGSDGKWKAQIKTPSAGGPYELKVKGENENINFKNVLIGEVWICSGQSNMEMPLEGWPPNDLIERSKETIENAKNSNIRLFTVARTISVKPNDDCIGYWEESSPVTAATFSATAYFFGKRLYDELKVPVGLIHSSWGGTPAEAWTRAKYLEGFPAYKETLGKLPEGEKEIRKLNEWLNGLPQIDVSQKFADDRYKNIDFNDYECSKLDFDDSSWREMDLPVLWEYAELGNFDGVVWFRKSIDLPQSLINKDLVLELGPIDDIDITYVNGLKIGGYETMGFYNADRTYPIPKELITDNKVNIAVRVVDTQGGGGIYGKKEKFIIHVKDGVENVSLAGKWKYNPVAEYGNMKFYVFGKNGEMFNERPKVSIDFSANTPTTLYNGMIAPLIPFNIRGAIWYQGESNVGRAEEYQKLFPTMITNWRDDWGEGDFPFYFVQIAPYDYGKDSHSELLREAQMKTLSLVNTGMAVTLDIGNPQNIHPGKKYEVGNRLALWALAKDYGKDVVFSGPVYESYDIKDNKIILSFKYAESGLKINEINNSNNFEIAGEDNVYKKAIVEVDGNKLIVYNPEIKAPASVHYCMDNISEATLFNNDGLPASSFRTDE